MYGQHISPNQSKVHQLYQLDQLMHEESGTLQSLQRDKEDLERALGGLRKRIQEGNGPPQIIEAARKQQHTLERELSRVHQMLAENSKVVKVPSRRRFYFPFFVVCYWSCGWPSSSSSLFVAVFFLFMHIIISEKIVYLKHYTFINLAYCFQCVYP